MSGYGGELSNTLDEWFKNNNGTWIIGICPSCKNGVLIHAFDEMGVKKSRIYPHSLPSPTDERIPKKIREAINEAKLCLSVDAPMASSSMSRRSIQCACIDKGATITNDLYKQIGELFDNGIITEQIKNWAHSVRWVGNDGAHPTSTEVTQENAKDVLDLAEQLMAIFYIMPSIAKKHKEKHEKKGEPKDDKE